MFDWVTWSIWFVGFTILVMWIVVPIREFRQIAKRKKSMKRELAEEGSNARTGSESQS